MHPKSPEIGKIGHRWSPEVGTRFSERDSRFPEWDTLYPEMSTMFPEWGTRYPERGTTFFYPARYSLVVKILFLLFERRTQSR